MASIDGFHASEAAKSQGALPSEAYSRKAFPQILRTTDLLALYILAIFWITNGTTAASGGAVSYIYWIVGGITFFIPCVIAAAQLGVMLPHEGSIYNWTHRALGPYWGFFVGLCWWFPAPLIVISAGDTIVSYVQGLNSTWLIEPWQQGIVVLAIIAFSGLVALQRTRTVQNLCNVGAGLILLVMLLLGVAAVKWLLTGHTSQTSFVHPSDWSITPQNFGLYSLITLAYLGVQVPLNMGGEIVETSEQQKGQAVKRHLLWGTLCVFAGYFLVTFALHFIEGATNVTSPFAVVAALDKVFGEAVGNIAVMCIMGFFVISAIMYNASFARLLFVGSIDKHLPVGVGRLNKNRVPANAILLQTIVAMIFAALVFLVVPYIVPLGGGPANLALEFFNVALAVVVIVWALITIFFYIDLVALYRRDRERFHQQRIFPMVLLWASIVIGPVGCCAAIAGAIYYSWIATLIPNNVWLLVVGGLVITCFVCVAIGSILATSEATWQNMSRE